MSGPGRGQRPPGSECCVVGGDDHGEAYTAIVQGGRLNRESSNIAEAEAFSVAEGNMCGTVMRGAYALPRSKTPSRTKGSRRNLGDPTFGQRRQCASGYGDAPHRLPRTCSSCFQLVTKRLPSLGQSLPRPSEPRDSRFKIGAKLTRTLESARIAGADGTSDM